MLKSRTDKSQYDRFSLRGAALAFIRDCYEDLRFSEEKTEAEKALGYLGTSLHEKEII